ncbi:hydrogenase maturation protein HypC [Rhodococcus erythropolis]|nr:hydrogenase maturation protein HypC [Rhodococcus erythropolis]
MCLGIPGRVRELLDGYGGQLALVDVEGAPRKVNIGMLDEGTVTAGDWVVIHMGFAVEKVDEQGAQRAGRPRLMGRGQDGEIDESDTRTGEVGT